MSATGRRQRSRQIRAAGWRPLGPLEIARFIAEHHDPTASEAFEFGLDRLLDGIQGYLSGE